MMSMSEIFDLRTALAFLKTRGENIQECSQEISPVYEIANHYAKFVAGVPGSVYSREEMPTLYTNVKKYTMPVLMGLFGSRRRNNQLLSGSDQISLPLLLNALNYRQSPIKIKNPPCQKNVITEDIDLLKIIPILTLTSMDAGPYITLGLIYASDPYSGQKNISIHRLCVQGPDTMTIWMTPRRHLKSFYSNAVSNGRNLPISINIGLDPAIYFSSCFSEPLIKRGENELDIAGGLRNHPVMVSDCVSVSAECISYAEIVIEGEILNELSDENKRDSSGGSMPEFLGYFGASKSSIPVVKIKAVTHRNMPIYQSVLGPGKEQSELLAIPTEASVIKLLQENLQIDVQNAYYSPSGGGQLLLILQFKKHSGRDDFVVRQAGLMILSIFNMLKHVILIDDDVNIYSHEDIFWALTTRFQFDVDTVVIPHQQGFPMDPSQSPIYSKNISEPGVTTKCIFDCTVPWRLKKNFERTF